MFGMGWVGFDVGLMGWLGWGLCDWVGLGWVGLEVGAGVGAVGLVGAPGLRTNLKGGFLWDGLGWV